MTSGEATISISTGLNDGVGTLTTEMLTSHILDRLKGGWTPLVGLLHPCALRNFLQSADEVNKESLSIRLHFTLGETKLLKLFDCHV